MLVCPSLLSLATRIATAPLQLRRAHGAMRSVMSSGRSRRCSSSKATCGRGATGGKVMKQTV